MKHEVETEGKSIKISIDVTKIVKYVCFTAIIIVSVVFGTNYVVKALKQEEN